MKIVQINAVCGSGSTGRICLEIMDYINNSKDDECVLFFGNGKPSDKSGAFIMNTPNCVKFHGLMARLMGKAAYFSHFHTKKLISQLKKIKPDIVHLHNLHGNYVHLNMLLQYLAKNDIPTVITLHDCWFFTGKCTHYTVDGCYKWQTECHDCPRLKKDIPSWFFDCTKKMWHDKKERFEAIPRLAVIGVSDWITNEARKSFLKNAKIIKRIYNWIDLDTFYPRKDDISAQYGLDPTKFHVLLIGAGWHENSAKFKDMLKLSEVLGDDIQIILAGTVHDNVGLPKNVVTIGYINGTDELAKVYSYADAYVHLSYEDTFGKVIAEAMACGTPAVVYDSTACAELVPENCGYSVKPGDINTVKEKISEIKNNTKAHYSEECIKHVKNNFEKNMLIEDTLSLYKKLINQE